MVQMNSMRYRLLGPALCMMIGLCGSQAEAQGKLDALEADASKKEGHHSEQTAPSGISFSEFWGGLCVDLFTITLLYGGVSSLQRVSEFDAPDPDVIPRTLGEPLIPFARMDVAYQAVESDVESLDVRGEVGYGPVGIHLDFTRYWEETPADDLNLIRVLGLYRMSLGPHVEADLGFGVLTVRGDETTSKFLFSLPIAVHPSKYWGMELRPAWADRISDYDVAVMLTRDFVSLKGGYRWVRSPNESLNGPYVGLSVRL